MNSRFRLNYCNLVWSGHVPSGRWGNDDDADTAFKWHRLCSVAEDAFEIQVLET